MIDASRVDRAPHLVRRIVAVDPPAETQAECGIIALGLAARTTEKSGKAARHVYVTDDYSIRGRSEVWGKRIVDAYRDTGAQVAVVERNQGGDMIRGVIHAVDATVNVEPVQASVSKWMRAEPVAAHYQRVHHVAFLPMLEAQMTTWTEGDEVSPDRLDALVHGVRFLMPDIVKPPARVRSAAGTPLRTGSRRAPTFGG
jgi:phage terminase large subunit-like protein